MLPYIIAGIAGAYLANRRVPTVKVKRLDCLGPISGLTYKVEELPESGIIIVRHGVTTVTFTRSSDGYKVLNCDGSPEMVNTIKKDFSRR